MHQPHLWLEQVQLTESMPRGSTQVSFLLLLATVLIWSLAFVIFKNKFLDSIKPLTPSASQTLSIDKYYGWKIYENEKYKFSLKYPTHWYVRKFSALAANFQETDPRAREATPAAIKVRFSAQSDPFALKEFEKINKIKVGEQIREPLDVVSIITKVRDFEVGANSAVEYTTDRTFTALEGPPKEYRHTYSIRIDGTILKFIAAGDTKEEIQIYQKLFQIIILSIKF